MPEAHLGGWVQCLSTAFDSGLILLDEKGEVSLVNQVAVKLLGKSLEELAEEWPEIHQNISRQHSPELWEKGGEVEVTLPAAEGRDHRFLLDVVPVDLEGCKGHLLQIRDSPAVQAAERDRLLASQMNSTSRLYRSVAHDLRSPLNAMVVNLELLGDAVGPDASGEDLEARRQRYVRVLKEEMERLNKRLQAFLSQTAPADGTRRREFDLSEMIRDMALFVEPQANKQNTELELKLADDPMNWYGNPDKIRQAVLCLVVNALEALDSQDRPDGGGRVEIGAHDIGDEIALWIADDGPGIPEAIADHVFDLHVTTKENGSGIGLHVARDVIEDHGGELTLARPGEAGPGTGAVFKIRLPAHSEEPPKESGT